MGKCSITPSSIDRLTTHITAKEVLTATASPSPAKPQETATQHLFSPPGLTRKATDPPTAIPFTPQPKAASPFTMGTSAPKPSPFTATQPTGATGTPTSPTPAAAPAPAFTNFTPPPGTAVDPTMMAFMAFMQQQQAQLITQLTTNSRPTKPAQTFPKWDGKPSSQANYLELLLTFQQDPYFAGATWTHLSPGFEAQSTYLRHSILNSLPTLELDQFLHQPEFKNDRFKMFSRLIDRLQPAANESKLTNILALASLAFEPQDTIDSFILKTYQSKALFLFLFSVASTRTSSLEFVGIFLPSSLHL